MSNNNKLSLKATLSLGFGQAIGAGIVTMTAIGIAMTGKGVSLAFLTAGLLSLVCFAPTIIMSGTAPRYGGTYTYVKELFHPICGVFYLVIFAIAKIGIAMFGVSFANYILTGVLGVTEYTTLTVNIIAAVVITIFYLVNLKGLDSTVKIQSIMVITLITVLISFIFIGLPKADFSNLISLDTLMPHGVSPFMSASALLIFGIAGGVTLVDYGPNIENPRKNVPLAIVIITIGLALFTCAFSYVAASTIPLTNQDTHLFMVAEAIGGPIYGKIFVIGAALLALATTINANFPWFEKVMIKGVEDGFLPEVLGRKNKHGANYVLLTILWAISIIMLTFNLQIMLLGTVATALTLITNIIPGLTLIAAPKKYKEEWETSPFKLKSNILAVFIAIFSTSVLTYVIYSLARTWSKEVVIAVAIAMFIAMVYSVVVGMKIEKQKKDNKNNIGNIK